MFEDELPAKKASSEFPRNLENMSVDELQEYIEELKGEIDRVQGDMDKKKASQDAAAAVFKS